MDVYNLREDDFDKVIALGERLNGKNYLDHSTLDGILRKSCRAGLNASFVAYKEGRGSQLLAFRLTYAPGNWIPDKWLCPEKWQVPPEKVCYFKANMVDPEHQSQGVGSLMLKASIRIAKAQGAVAGVTHIWMQSPGNSAYKYFVKAGGEVLHIHPDRWNEDCEKGYNCIRCGNDCHCDGAEMILYFDKGIRS